MTTVGYIEAKCTVPASTTLTATSNSGGPTPVAITAGTYYLSDLCTHIAAQLTATRPVTAGAWSMSMSTVTGLVTISVSAGTFSITWTTAALGTLLGHSTITTQASVTGAAACHGIWIPDRPLNCDLDPRIAPRKTDLRTTESPTGGMLGVVGNSRYVHPNFRWSHVSRERVWDTDSGVTPSWERFVLNTQLGQGHSWFTPVSAVRVYDQTGAAIGNTSSVTTWKMRGVTEVTAKKNVETWTGAWLVEIPALVAES